MITKGVLRLDGQEFELIRHALLEVAATKSGHTARQLEILASKVLVSKTRFHNRVYRHFATRYDLPENPCPESKPIKKGL